MTGAARRGRRLPDDPPSARVQARRARATARTSFATFLEQAGASTITTELALAWAIRSNGTESWKAARLSIIRGFAAYLRTIDPATEIPPSGILIARKHYAIPYLYSEQEIGRLLAEAAALRPPLRAADATTR